MILLFWFILLYAGQHIPDKTLVTGNDKPWLAIYHIDTALLKNAKAVVRNEESTYIIESPQKYVFRCHKVVTLFDDSDDRNLLMVDYNQYSKAEILEAAIYDAMGKLIRKIKDSEIQDNLVYDGVSFYRDVRVKWIMFSGGRLPYTIEYTYEQTHKETMSFQPWEPITFEETCEKASMTITAPELIFPFVEDKNSKFSSTTNDQQGFISKTWTIHKFLPTTREDYSPVDHEVLPILLLSPSQFQVESYKGSMENWESFGKFLYTINEGKENLTPDMAAKVKNMIAGLSEPRLKIDTLYRWLQDNMRYVSIQFGIGGWQSFDAAYVEKNKFGDCKALSTFMKGMLKAAGIDSWQVVIRWDEDPTLLAQDFATSYFNHVMLYIPSESMWLECTSNYLPPGMIDKDCEGKKVLLITPEGGVLAETPLSPSADNVIHTIDTISWEDGWVIEGKKVYFGNTQSLPRSLENYLTEEDRKKRFLEEFQLNVSSLETLSWFSDMTGHHAGYQYHLHVNQLATVSSDRIFIPINPMYPVAYSCVTDQTRKSEVVFNKDHTLENDIYIRIPQGYLMEHLPAPINLEHAICKFQMKITAEGEYLHVSRRCTFLPARLPASEYNGICQFLNEVRKADAKKIVLLFKA